MDMDPVFDFSPREHWAASWSSFAVLISRYRWTLLSHFKLIHHFSLALDAIFTWVWIAETFVTIALLILGNPSLVLFRMRLLYSPLICESFDGILKKHWLLDPIFITFWIEVASHVDFFALVLLVFRVLMACEVFFSAESFPLDFDCKRLPLFLDNQQVFIGWIRLVLHCILPRGAPLLLKLNFFVEQLQRLYFDQILFFWKHAYRVFLIVIQGFTDQQWSINWFTHLLGELAD